MTRHHFLRIMEDLDVQIKVLEVEEGVQAAWDESQIVVQRALVNHVSGNVVLDGLEDQIIFEYLAELDVSYELLDIELRKSDEALGEVSQELDALQVFIDLLFALNLRVDGFEQFQFVDACFGAADDQLQGLVRKLEQIFANDWII